MVNLYNVKMTHATGDLSAIACLLKNSLLPPKPKFSRTENASKFERFAHNASRRNFIFVNSASKSFSTDTACLHQLPCKETLIGMAAMATQQEKADRFRKLHDGPSPFVIPNPWDVGSARMLAGLGFRALATSSAAAANAAGRRDHALTRDEMLAHARLIVGATDLPVSADLGNGFGDSPEVVGETIRLAADAGLVGCTIEDATGNQDRPLYDFPFAVDRIAAAAEVARALPFPFVLTARAHNFMYASPRLDETISRLQAFEKAGADVLFAPGLPDLAAVRAVCSAVSRPFNFMVGIKGKSFSIAELAAAGVRRISLASSLYRAAMTGFVNAAREVNSGQFAFVEQCMTTAELNTLMHI